MPPQILLPPAGLLPFEREGGASTSTSTHRRARQTSSPSRASSSHTRRLRIPSTSSSGSMDAAAASTTTTATHAQPHHTLKRTLSTASVNERVMDMLNPRHQQEMQYAPDSDDEDLAAVAQLQHAPRTTAAGMGMQEDWEVEQHDDGSSSSSDDGRERDVEEDDPFNDTPAVRKRLASASDMVLDSPTSSPTTRRTSNGYNKPTTCAPPSASPTKRKMASHHNATMLSDDEDNPFTVKPSKRGAASPPAAPRRQAPKGTDRVSYVFRGKRITYNASLDAMYPTSDNDDPEDAELQSRLKAQSGPRVLFPSPPTPIASTSMLPPHQVSPPSNRTASNPTALVMQTPVRKKAPAAAGFSTPADRITAALQSGAAERERVGAGAKKDDGGFGRREKEREPAAPFVPPTPASLPQKSKAERDSIERERLASAMRGIQAAHSRAAQATSQQAHAHALPAESAARRSRYAPYPPR